MCPCGVWRCDVSAGLRPASASGHGTGVRQTPRVWSRKWAGKPVFRGGEETACKETTRSPVMGLRRAPLCSPTPPEDLPMPRGKRYSIDEGELLRLYEQEQLSQYEIAHRLGIPRSSVRNRLVKFIQPVQVEIPAAQSTNGSPAAAPQPQRPHWTRVLGALRTEQGQQALRELIVWWHERTTAIARASNASRQTERITFQVERRWVQALRSMSDADGMPISQVVNEALRDYFTRREGHPGAAVST